MENNRCCEKCRFYNPEGRECRRYPPQVWGDPQSDTNCSYSVNFPSVSKDTWCGEFKSKEEKDNDIIIEDGYFKMKINKNTLGTTYHEISY